MRQARNQKAIGSNPILGILAVTLGKALFEILPRKLQGLSTQSPEINIDSNTHIKRKLMINSLYNRNSVHPTWQVAVNIPY